jgi:hypothetical protein
MWIWIKRPCGLTLSWSLARSQSVVLNQVVLLRWTWSTKFANYTNVLQDCEMYHLPHFLSFHKKSIMHSIGECPWRVETATMLQAPYRCGSSFVIPACARLQAVFPREGCDTMSLRNALVPQSSFPILISAGHDLYHIRTPTMMRLIVTDLSWNLLPSQGKSHRNPASPVINTLSYGSNCYPKPPQWRRALQKSPPHRLSVDWRTLSIQPGENPREGSTCQGSRSIWRVWSTSTAALDGLVIWSILINSTGYPWCLRRMQYRHTS